MTHTPAEHPSMQDHENTFFSLCWKEREVEKTSRCCKIGVVEMVGGDVLASVKSCRPGFGKMSASP